jgi:hypothetical protein
VDAANRLRVRETGASRRLRPVRILDGTFAVDRRNRLRYLAESPSTSGGPPVPRVIDLDGTWTLTPRHTLALTLRGTERAARQTLSLNAALLRAESHALVFGLHRRAGDDGQSLRELRLSGRWQADARNRLTFLAERADGGADRFTLQGGWELGPHHALTYRYRRPSTGARDGGRSAQQILSFDGAWDMTRAGRLVYRLSGSGDSAFEFRASLQSPSLVAREGRLAYQVGIGVSGGRTLQRRVTLFGAWKLRRDLSVSFEVPYAGGRVQAIRFEGEAAPGPRNQIAVALSTSRREPLGVTVTFSRELVPDARLFLQLRRDAEERSVIGGVQVQF